MVQYNGTMQCTYWYMMLQCNVMVQCNGTMQYNGEMTQCLTCFYLKVNREIQQRSPLSGSRRPSLSREVFKNIFLISKTGKMLLRIPVREPTRKINPGIESPKDTASIGKNIFDVPPQYDQHDPGDPVPADHAAPEETVRLGSCPTLPHHQARPAPSLHLTVVNIDISHQSPQFTTVHLAMLLPGEIQESQTGNGFFQISAKFLVNRKTLKSNIFYVICLFNLIRLVISYKAPQLSL